ncbi:MAG: type II toxin-antitoxin system VapB family antitoxin [Mycobacteriales bacterium]
MTKRTTIEIDEQLLARAKRRLRCSTTRATVEQALRQAADGEEARQVERAVQQRSYFTALPQYADMAVLNSEQMWR